MKLKIEIKKNANSKTYYSFSLIDIKFINSCQVWSINVTLFNVFFQILKNKKPYDTEGTISYEDCSDSFKESVKNVWGKVYPSIEDSVG